MTGYRIDRQYDPRDLRDGEKVEVEVDGGYIGEPILDRELDTEVSAYHDELLARGEADSGVEAVYVASRRA